MGSGALQWWLCVLSNASPLLNSISLSSHLSINVCYSSFFEAFAGKEHWKVKLCPQSSHCLSAPQEFTAVKYFSIDRVFRNETLDATHLAEFHQIEGVVADYGLTLGDLMGVLKEFFNKLGKENIRLIGIYVRCVWKEQALLHLRSAIHGSHIGCFLLNLPICLVMSVYIFVLGITKLRFKPAYNPYTEPSMEVFSYHEGKPDCSEVPQPVCMADVYETSVESFSHARPVHADRIDQGCQTPFRRGPHRHYSCPQRAGFICKTI